LRPQAKESEFGTDSLARSSRCSNVNVVVRSVESLEDLSLDLVERRDRVGVDGFVFPVVESRDGERLKVEKSCGRRELLGKNEMFEGERETSFGMEPSIRDDRDEVVGRQRIHHRNGEGDVVILFSVTLAEDELVVEENDLSVDIFNEDPERFRCAVDLLLPLEVGSDGELDSEKRSSDRLNVSRKLD
jgi:hypothetical protein